MQKIKVALIYSILNFGNMLLLEEIVKVVGAFYMTWVCLFPIFQEQNVLIKRIEAIP